MKLFLPQYVVFLMLATSTCAADWPHWRGQNRSGVIDENSGYSGQSWTLKEVWQLNFGAGSTSPIVVDNRLYAVGHKRGEEVVTCVDAGSGKPLWNSRYRAPAYGRKANGDQGIYRGTSSTPSFDSETSYLYTLGIDGDLHCWDTKREGAKVWGTNLYDEFDPPQRPKVGRSGQRDYGYTSSPLVWGETLITEVGGKQGNTIGFDKRTGKVLWTSENGDPAGHTGGPVPITVEGKPCLAVLTHFNLLIMRLDRGREGETVAEFPWVTHFANSIASPVVHENFVLITSGYNQQSLCKIEITMRGAKQIWKRDVHSGVCTPIVHKGRIYWSWRDVYCLDSKTGETVWKGPSGLGDPGSCIVTGDERLIVWSNEGTLLLMETAQRSPSRPHVLFRRDRVFNTDAWPHIVLADGRLFCKDRDGNLKCFEIVTR